MRIRLVLFCSIIVSGLVFCPFTLLLSQPESRVIDRDIPISKQLITEIVESRIQLSSGAEKKKDKLLRKNRINNPKLVRLGRIKDFEKGKLLSFNISGLKGQIKAKRKSLEVFENGRFLWSGAMDDFTTSVDFYGNEEGVLGRIRYNDQIFMIEALDPNTSLLYSIKSEEVGECGNLSSSHESEIKSKHSTTKSADQLPIRIGFMYTQAAENTGLSMQNIAQQGMQDLWNARANSGISVNDANFELAGIQKVFSFTESNDMCDDIGDVASNTPSEITTFRNSVLADVIVIITGHNETGGPNGCVPAIPANVNNAYAMVRAPAANPDFSLTHEVMHLIGARHQQCGCCVGAGGYVCEEEPNPGFNYGYRIRKLIFPPFFYSKKRSLMHTYAPSYSRVNILSNPEISVSGKSFGVEGSNNNARLIAERACIVAGFLSSAMTVELSGPSTLSNYSYGTWCVNIQNCSSVQSINWAYSTDGWSYTSDGTGTCYMQNMFLGGNFPVGYFILRVTVVCSDGQTITKFLTVNNSTGLISSNQDSKSAAKTKENKFNPEIDFVDDFKLFPNPATNDFNVWYKFKANTTTIISLTSMDGKSSVLLNRANEIDGDEIYNVNVKNMTPGIYLITVRNGEDYSTKRIVIHE